MLQAIQLPGPSRDNLIFSGHKTMLSCRHEPIVFRLRHHIIYQNQYFVLTNFGNAQAVYERVIRNSDSPIGIVVLGVDIGTLTYWGYSDKGLWEWLRSHGIR